MPESSLEDAACGGRCVALAAQSEAESDARDLYPCSAEIDELRSEPPSGCVRSSGAVVAHRLRRGL